MAEKIRTNFTRGATVSARRKTMHRSGGTENEPLGVCAHLDFARSNGEIEFVVTQTLVKSS